MGNNIAADFRAYTLPHLWKEDEPDSFAPYKYDPQFGFDKPREERVTRATKEMMDSGGLMEKDRGFCAMQRMNWRGCLFANFPLVFKCKGYFNEIAHCDLQERYHDMKEYEREKRLNARERILKERSSASA